MGLTHKQARFVAEYLIDGNATRAASAAGYSARTAQEQGSRLLSNVMVAEAVAKGQKAALSKAGLSADLVRNRLRQIISFDIRKLYDVNGNLIPIPELDDDTAAAINSVEVLVERSRNNDDNQSSTISHTHKIKAVDVARAVELGMRHFGLGKDVHEHTGPDGGPLEVTSDVELARRVAFLLIRGSPAAPEHDPTQDSGAGNGATERAS